MLLSPWYEKHPHTCPQVSSLESPFADFLKPVFFFLARLVYFLYFHPLARFPGPFLSKGGDVMTETFIATSADDVHRAIGIILFLAVGVHG